MDTSASEFQPGDLVNYVMQPQNRWAYKLGTAAKASACTKHKGVFLKFVPKKSAAVEFTRSNGLKTVRIVQVEKLEKREE